MTFWCPMQGSVLEMITSGFRMACAGLEPADPSRGLRGRLGASFALYGSSSDALPACALFAAGGTGNGLRFLLKQ